MERLLLTILLCKIGDEDVLNQWIKWKLIIRWKNQWNYLKLFRDIPSGNKLWIMAVIMGAINFITIFLGTYFLLKYSLFNKNLLNSQFDGIITNILGEVFSFISNDYSTLWSLVFLIIILFSILTGISSSKWKRYSIDKDWLMTNLKISSSKANLYLYVESIVWYLKDYMFSYVPVLLALSLLTETSWIRISFSIFLTLFLFVSISLITSVFHNHYLSIQNYQSNFIFRVIFALIFRIGIVFVSFLGGKILSPWLYQFPINSNDINIEVYQDWINKGSDIFLDLLMPLFTALQYSFLPNNILTMILFDTLTFPSLIILVCTFIFLYIAAVYLVKHEPHSDQKRYYAFEKFENISINILKPFGKSYSNILFKHHFRGEYFANKFPILMGSLPFWILIGAFSGILRGMDSNVFYFLLAFYLFFFVYFYVDAVYSELSGIFSLDSEGKQILIHLVGGKSLWEVFKYKLRFFISLTFPLFFLSDIAFLIINHVEFKLSILILFLHLTAIFLFSLLLFLPSIISPHFNFLNIEQLDEYPDKKSVQGMIKLLMLGIIIPGIMLPTAFFITNMINLQSYIFYQFILIFGLMFTSIIILLLFIRSRLTKMKTFDQLSL